MAGAVVCQACAALPRWHAAHADDPDEPGRQVLVVDTTTDEDSWRTWDGQVDLGL